MVTCPKCKADNRPEAAFCSRCGTILIAQPAPAKMTEPALEIFSSEMEAVRQPDLVLERTITATEVPTDQPEPVPAAPIGIQKRAEGAMFAGRFRYDSLLSREEHEIHYTVTETVEPDTPCVRICSNPECRTIHSPTGDEPEKFCTQCGHPLEEQSLLFHLLETDADKFDYVKHVIELNLVHPNIHPPIATFGQEWSDGLRYYLVTPYSDDIPQNPELSDVLDWGEQLANALDYLQTKGVLLGEEVDASSIGLVNNKAVWRNFTSVRILPMLTDREKINNFRLLCLVMYSLMTGNSTYQMDPHLPQAVNELLDRGLNGEGFTSGADLGQQIELAKTSGVDRLVLDIEVGRRSHPGKVRSHNEDSLLSLELSKVILGETKSCGLFAIADGMGGHTAGDVASGLVIQIIAQKAGGEIFSLQEAASPDYADWLEETAQGANLAVYEARQKAGNDMGSTLVMCLLVDNVAYLTHQGDSRTYIINREAIKQLTTDHSLVQHMVSIGQISQDEARFHPQRNVIYRSLGDKPVVEVQCITQQLFPHDRLLLCSDGLTNLLEDEKIQKIVLGANSPQAACDELVQAANHAGGDDNISVIVIEVITV